VIGGVFITTGVLMLLFVTYQLWWSIRAGAPAGGQCAHHLQETGRAASASRGRSRRAGVRHPAIPKLDVVAADRRGLDKSKVLDRGMVATRRAA